MASLFRTCLDGHRCENGSSCAQHPTEEGKYYCDCGTSNGDFAGLFCEYEAETYCQMPQETTSNWFCMNQGTCVLSTGGSEAQWNCDCPAEFDGPVRIERSSTKKILLNDFLSPQFVVCVLSEIHFTAALSIHSRQRSKRLAGL